MKHIVAMMTFVLTVSLYQTALADYQHLIQESELPTNAQLFIKEHFAQEKVKHAFCETEVLSKSYTVYLTDGTSIEFDRQGKWTEVKAPRGQVIRPEIIPEAIDVYVKSHFPDASINEIEKDSRKYEIQLSNGFEIKFNKNMKVVDIDD